jgi:hypothetical protein
LTCSCLPPPRAGFAKQELVYLAPLPGGGIGGGDVDVPAALQQLEQQEQQQRLDFLGPELAADVARGIAEGGFLR